MVLHIFLQKEIQHTKYIKIHKKKGIKKMIKENTLIHGNAKYIVRFNETRIGISGQQPVKFLKYDEAGKLIAERELMFRTGDEYVVPEFRTYEDVRRFWSYPNRAKLEVRTKTIYDVKEITI